LRTWLASLGLLRVGAIVDAPRGPRHRWLLPDGWAIIAIVIFAAAVLIDPGIAAVDIAIDNFVGWSRTIVAARLRIGLATVAGGGYRPIHGPVSTCIAAGRIVAPVVVSIIS
jgi:hypothetical protein